MPVMGAPKPGVAFAFALVLLAPAGCKRGKAGDTQTTSATSASVDAQAPPATTFARKAPVVNAKATEKGTSKTNLVTSIDSGNGKPQLQTLDETDAEQKVEQVLAVADDAITKMQITYDDKTTTTVEGGKTKTTTSALKGKTYVVEAKGDGKLDVRDAKGKPAPPREAKLVSQDYRSLGKPDPVLKAMPERALAVGESVPELAQAITDELKDDSPDLDVSGVTVKFAGATGDEGSFDVTATFGKAEGPVKFTMPLTGTMKVRTSDSQLSALTLEGPVTVAPNDDPKAKPSKLKIEGTGTMKIEEQRVYE